MPSSDAAPTATVDAFLSHSYGAPDVNLFFFELISTVASIAFRVDRGTFRTSTTRLERMIRDADAFFAVWPLPGAPRATWSAEGLTDASRYFRLELDMALRARKPGVVFFDRRYRGRLQTPPELHAVPYDPQDVVLSTAAPGWRRLEAMVESAWRDLELRPSSLRALRGCDFVVIDTGDAAAQALGAFLHGQSIPLLRVRPDVPDPEPSPVEEVLFGDLEVGYRRDVVRWTTEQELRERLDERLTVIDRQPELIGDPDGARRYFSSAAKRKEPVFLSYSGADAEVASQFAQELGRRFQEVFDYRERESIPAGEFWQDHISGALSGAAIGVILFSSSYARSGHCMEEARHLVRRKVESQARLLPVRLDDSRAPEVLAGLEYRRLGEWGRPAELIAAWLRQLDA